uniref:Uncharacterized protein n=1 Tax=Timema tahoe TaxID=61484 RepID=A0A7R9FIP4_9NEOP|nr:unnamed protein product [Timema tahoe]
MLWPLLVLSHVLLVTSRPYSPAIGQVVDDVTWNNLLQQQWMENPSSERETENPDPPGEIDVISPRKRGLAALGRWRPFTMSLNNLVGRYAPRAPMAPVVPEMDFVSAETRGILRPLGQPLRWGRR